MRKIVFFAACFSLIALSCGSEFKYKSPDGHSWRSRADYEYYLMKTREREASHKRKSIEIMERTQAKGYLNLEDLDWVLNDCKHFSLDLQSFMSEVIQNDLLPFKGIFYLALENEDYDAAELTRRSWVYHLKCILKKFSNAHGFEQTQKLNYEIEKLTSIVGLADQILVKLRKEFVIALEQKNWDNAEKIQNIISGRVKELRPEPLVVHEKTPAGKTVVVLKQPSEQHVKVEQIPRYGAEDVGRAISLLQGRGGMLTGKESGTLKVLDILMNR